MDEMTSELLSRYLDDDLSTVERAEFERRLEAEPGLRAEAETGRELRRAVSRIAGEMKPPAALDAVMAPMLQSAPAPERRVRPAFRWLGAAAAVVLGVTVTLEVAQRNPQPIIEESPAPRVINHDDREIFQLAPLPSAVPGEDRPLGATERLLEEELTAPEAPEPQPLEIVGPLPMDEGPASEEPVSTGLAGARSARGTTDTTADISAAMPKIRAAAPDGEADRVESASREKGGRAPAAESTGTAAHQMGAADGRSKRAATPEREQTASVFIADREVWSGRVRGCDAGTYEIRLEIQRGVVVSKVVISMSAVWSSSCIPEALYLATLEEVEDGWVEATLVVQ